MASIAVTAPVPGFTGDRAGVRFDDGRGEVEADNASALAYFARHGYALDERAARPMKERRARPAPTEIEDAPAAAQAEG